MEFRLHEMGPELAVAQVFIPFSQALQALQSYRDFTAEMAPEIGCYLLAVNVPPIAPFPEAHHGKTAIAIVASHCGGIEAGMAALKPLTEVGDPIFSLLTPAPPYTTLQTSFDAANPAGKRFSGRRSTSMRSPTRPSTRSCSTPTRCPGLQRGVLRGAGWRHGRARASGHGLPAPPRGVQLRRGGRLEDASGDERSIAWVRSFHAAILPFGNGRVDANSWALTTSKARAGLTGRTPSGAVGQGHLRSRWCPLASRLRPPLGGWCETRVLRG